MGSALRQLVKLNSPEIFGCKGDDVFFARIIVENQSEQVFLKLYPQKSGSRGLLNEVLGYLYGTVANVPQPKFAGIAIVPVELLKPYSKSLSNSLQSVIDNETHLPAFFTKSITGTQYLYDYLNPWLKQAREVANDK